ncbi:MAG: hypothetical protein KatS3mg121_1479 [Gammaproteobacteria bacterium]|nr:MAG: hypothetical protein KatS3mg121_1479 [Gammaproteobacteria bacterium]
MRSAWLALWLAPLCAAAAADLENPSRIEAAARAALLADENGDERGTVSLRVDLDRRLRLPRCRQAPVAAPPPAARAYGPSAVAVSCPDPQWRIYVPVRLHRRVAVVVSARPLQRDQALTAADLRLEARDLNRLGGGYFDSVEALVGLRLRRHLAAGQVITPGLVERPRWVESGRRVTLVWQDGRIAVHAEGTALQGGGAGDRVRVRNLRSGRIVEGRVTGPDRVAVGP